MEPRGGMESLNAKSPPPGIRFQAFFQLLEEGGRRGIRPVALALEGERGGDEALGVEAQRLVLQFPQAAHEERSAGQQDERNRHLRHDQEPAHKHSRRPDAVPASEGFGTRPFERGRHAEQQRRGHSGCHGEKEHAQIHTSLLKPHQASGRQAYKKPHQHPSQGASGHAAGDSQQQAFGEHLPDQAATAGANGGPHGQFPAPRRRAGQQQIGNVGARQQQEREHRA